MHIFFLLFILLSSCAPRIYEQTVHDYYLGNFEQADEKITKRMEKERKDSVLLYLNRAMARFADGKGQEAILDFQKALEEIDFFQQELFADFAGQLLIDDSQAPYKADDFEQSLARLYFALSLFYANDESNAFAILRQSEEEDQKKRLAYSCDPLAQNFYIGDNLLQKILFSYLLEKRGDRSNADILRDQIGVILPSFSPDKSLLIVVCHNGLAPRKISTLSSSAMASAYALEMILGSQGYEQAISSPFGIALPELCSPLAHFPIPITFQVGEQSRQLRTYCDIGFLAEQELRHKMPVIAAKAAARAIIRRALVGCAKEKDKDLGAWVDLGLLIANVCTQADTRSWNTLPMTIDAAFVQVEPGFHELNFQASLHDYCYNSSRHHISVQKGEICIINVFNLHPGITKIIIPNKNKEILCTK